MTINQALLIIAVILMILGACPIPSKVDLWKLGTAIALAALCVIR